MLSNGAMKNKAEEGEGRLGMGAAVMNRVVEGGLTEVTCDERPEEGVRVGKSAARSGRSRCKVLRLRQASCLPGTTQPGLLDCPEQAPVPVRPLVL